MDPDESMNKKLQVGRWSEAQHQRFMMGITLHGKDWKKVEDVVATRSGSQVRSHAQKFFNKLKKDQKKKSSGKKKSQSIESGELSDSQNSFMKMCPDDFSNTTPAELVSIIRKQSQGGQKVNISNLKKKLEDQMVIYEKEKQESEEQEEDIYKNLKRHNSFKSLNNILQAYENVRQNSQSNQLQDESFLINLTKRYKKYFAQGGRFENLIDFGNAQDLISAHHSNRKRSFTLPQGVQGDEDDLNERKKRVITESNVGNFTDKEKDVFRQAVLKRKQNEQKLLLQKNEQNKKGQVVEKSDKEEHQNN